VIGVGLGIAKCPYDPLDNSTAIYVEDGNPGGLPGLVSNVLKIKFERRKRSSQLYALYSI